MPLCHLEAQELGFQRQKANNLHRQQASFARKIVFDRGSTSWATHFSIQAHGGVAAVFFHGEI